jgi:hypothetical protein
MEDIQEHTTFTVILKNNEDSVVLDNADIIQCYFIEDIYSFVKNGKLIFKDNKGIVEFLPLMAGELLTIVYATNINGEEEYEDKTFTFVINKISNIEQSNNNNKIVELFFVEGYHYDLHFNHYSLSFEKKKRSDIIKYILKNHVKISEFVKWEDSSEFIDYFYTGQKTPADNIKWLMNRSSSISAGQAGYLLYSNTEKSNISINFVTLETLLAQKNTISKDKYTFNEENIHYSNKILNCNVSQVDYNTIQIISNNTYLGFDMQKKEFIKREYNYKDSLKRFTILGEWSLFDSDYIDISSGITTNTGETEKQIIDNLFYSDWIKQYCLQQLVTITIKGHNERYAGGMIEIDWPSTNTDSKQDKNMLGKYLIKSITHNFSPKSKPQYMQKMVLIKNGYYDTDRIGLEKAVKENK